MLKIIIINKKKMTSISLQSIWWSRAKARERNQRVCETVQCAIWHVQQNKCEWRWRSSVVQVFEEQSGRHIWQFYQVEFFEVSYKSWGSAHQTLFAHDATQRYRRRYSKRVEHEIVTLIEFLIERCEQYFLFFFIFYFILFSK